MDWNDLIGEFLEIPSSPIARGGQKIVFKGFHKKFGQVVIKISLNISERLLREIDIVSKINCRSVPKIFEFGELDYQGIPSIFILEEFIDGMVLSDKIKQFAPVNIQEGIDYLRQGLEFIQTLESNQIVHRDLKPDNIILKDNQMFFFGFWDC